MNLLSAFAIPLLRGAAVAALVAGLADGWAMALGGGADMYALALGTLLLAIGWGACHRGSARPPARAAFLWLVIGGCALPMLSAWASWSGLFGVVFVLPLRVLGARLSAFLEDAERPALVFGAQALGAALGVAWIAAAGLGFGGFVLMAAIAGFTTSSAPEVRSEPAGLDLPPWSRVAQYVTGMALGAGLVWGVALLAPLLRVHDASDAFADARAVLTLAAIVLVGWLTLGAFLADRGIGLTLAAAAAAAAALALPAAVRNWLAFSEPATFDALLRQSWLRSLLRTDTPRLPELHFAYVPVLMVVGAALVMLLYATALRAWIGRRPTGPHRLAPSLIGAGIALVVSTLPLLDGEAGAVRVGMAASCALMIAAIGMLVVAESGLLLRALTAGVVLIAAVWQLRPPPVPQPGFAIQDAREWSVCADADGRALQAAARGALWRVVGATAPDGSRSERLARGRNLLTPDLDAPGPWTREVEAALTLRPGAQRMMFAGVPHPASLRAAAAGGVGAAIYAGEAAAARLLAARDPAGYGLEFGQADSVARAPGAYDLILLRADALWDTDLPLLRAGLAAQAAQRLAPGGFCLLALGPEQLAPGILPSLLAAWREIFPRLTLYVIPDGLRGARLLLVAARHLEGEWPAALSALQLTAPMVADIARNADRARLAPPLPRVRAALAGTVPRLADPFAPVRRAAVTLLELAPATADASPSPTLLRAYALHYAAQEYSTHDTFVAPGPEAIEVRRAPLEELLRLARAHPESAWLHELWSDAAGTLAAKREVALVEEFLRPLREELGWRDAGITLALARASAELMDEEEARALLAELLAARPADPGALELLRILDGAGSLAPDAHGQHGHD